MKMNKKRGFLLVFEMKPTDASTSHPRDEHVGIAENLVESHDGLGPMVVQLDSLEKIEGFFSTTFRLFSTSDNIIKCLA